MSRINPLLLLLWLLIATLLYVWPFRLHLAPIFHTNDAEWATDGVKFANNGMLRTADAPRALFDRLVEGQGLTVEAWLTPATLEQSGPARIVTFSAGADERNFTLGAEGTALVFRLRTSRADPNGLANEITVPNVFVVGRAQHVSVVYDLASLAVYVDGELRAHFTGHEGTLDAWDPAHYLAVGNELTGDRPWRGLISGVIIINTPRSAAEIRADFQNGHVAAGSTVTTAYDFTQGPAGMTGNGAAPAALERPVAYIHGVYPDLLTREPRRLQDFVFNFGVFAVTGWLAVAVAGRRAGLRLRTMLVVATLITAAAVALESMQFYVVGRTSSLLDLSAAACGALVGVLLRGWRAPSSADRT